MIAQSGKIPALVLILFVVSSGYAREFTDTSGRKIEAEVVKVTAHKAVVTMGGNQFTIPLTKLSQPDQKYLAEWRAQHLADVVPDLDVQINTGKSNRSDASDDFDDRSGSFQFSITIENEENGYTLEGGKAVLSVIGENCDGDDLYCIMQKNDFQFALEDNGTFTWEGDKRSYTFDDRDPSRWGHEYYGYIFLLKNSKGKVIYEKVSHSKFESGVEAILGFSNNEAFDAGMRSRGRAYIYD